MNGPKDKTWATYEEVAAYVLGQCASEFGLDRVEGKQDIDGASGTSWQVDALGWAVDGTTFIVECKKHQDAAISQALTGSLAYTIVDTGAGGGFLVSPCGLQAGAKKVAAVAGIKEIKLDPRSTKAAYFGEWLGSLRAGFTDQVAVGVSEHLSITSVDENGDATQLYDSSVDSQTRS